MGLQVGLKKPVCIDSPVVYKFDIIQASDRPFTETVYSCQQMKIGSATGAIQQYTDLVNRRLNPLQMLFNRIKARGALHIVLDLKAGAQVVQGPHGEMRIGPQTLENGDFESQLLKRILMQRQLKNQPEAAEALADFLTNKKEVQSQWSRILQNTNDQLGVLEKSAFRQFVMNRLQTGVFANTRTVEEFFDQFLMVPIEEKGGRFLSAQYAESKFQNLFNKQLQKIGLKPSEQFFDVVIQSKTNGLIDLKELRALSEEYPDKRVAYQDRTGLYILPYMIKVGPEQTRLFKTEWTVLLSHEEISAAPLFSGRASKTDKLVLMNYQKSDARLDFKPLFKNGVPAFLGANKKVEFVQFHMSSLNFRLPYLRTVQNYFKWLKEERFRADKELALGWQSQFWSLERQAYKPVAVYDVIQYYRIN